MREVWLARYLDDETVAAEADGDGADGMADIALQMAVAVVDSAVAALDQIRQWAAEELAQLEEIEVRPEDVELVRVDQTRHNGWACSVYEVHHASKRIGRGSVARLRSK